MLRKRKMPDMNGSNYSSEATETNEVVLIATIFTVICVIILIVIGNAMVLIAPRANRLKIFKDNGISLEPHPGSYVPPPLVGIWARWPYMHNNSSCSVLHPL